MAVKDKEPGNDVEVSLPDSESHGGRVHETGMSDAGVSAAASVSGDATVVVGGAARGGGAASSVPPVTAQQLLPVAVARGLVDKLYEKRKTAALEIEKMVRDACGIGADPRRLPQLLNELVQVYACSVVANSRNGGLIALAAAAIAIGPGRVANFLEVIVPPILACFSDPDSRVRYYACEAMYNVAKVAKDDVLRFFNEIFDALCKLSADSDASVKNGAELLDRLIKDIVSERATYYNPQQHQQSDTASAILEDPLKSSASVNESSPPLTPRLKPSEPVFPPAPGSIPLPRSMKPTTFNLHRFIPLLAERIHTLNPFSRMFLVQWISVLDSVPDLELIAYLPDFVNGLFNYLSDPNVDVRVATLTLLGELLKELRDVVEVQREKGNGTLHVRGKKGSAFDGISGTAVISYPSSSSRLLSPGGAADLDDGGADDNASIRSIRTLDTHNEQQLAEQAEGGTNFMIFRQSSGNSMATYFVNSINASNSSGEPYTPGQNVVIDVGRMVEILGPHMNSTDEETQATALRWINEFIILVREIMLPFTPSLLAAILPGVSHPVALIRDIASETNINLYRLVMDTPFGVTQISKDGNLQASAAAATDAQVGTQGVDLSASVSTVSSGIVILDPFDLKSTVDTVTLQFQDDHEETRVTAMDWLLMLHRKAPRKFITNDETTFQALLHTLSDPSEEVVKRDLQLLAQMSQHSDDDYFMRFMGNLVTLFSTDRRLLESRGALIIRQLCLSLNPERMYRAFAEILERDEDLEFASNMVQYLNIILITAPELMDLRRRLKFLDTRDGLLLFAALYRSWCHNPVSTFSLCLLAQAYEHAANLLQIFASDLEITVPLLIQLDKLVQLIESPVFTYLRLQLLEPDRYPHLFRCLYGILMLLPQSSAFATLRNRLNSVSSMVMLYANGGPLSGTATGAHPASPPAASSGGLSSKSRKASSVQISGGGQQEPLTLRWHELLSHFRGVQTRHERNRRITRSSGPVSGDRSAIKRRNRNSRGAEEELDQSGLSPASAASAGNTAVGPAGSRMSVTSPSGNVTQSPNPSTSRPRDRSISDAANTTFDAGGLRGRASMDRLDRAGVTIGVGQGGGVVPGVESAPTATGTAVRTLTRPPSSIGVAPGPPVGAHSGSASSSPSSTASAAGSASPVVGKEGKKKSGLSILGGRR